MSKTEEYVKLIDDNIEDFIPVSDEKYSRLTDAMKYACTDGGKRVRPLLCLEFANICAADVKDALPFAMGVEMIHSYSLVHDDLPCMDNDDMRRGKPSTHKKFGEGLGLLAGDALLTHAFSSMLAAVCSDDKKVRAVSYLSENAGVNGMIGGQVIDTETEGTKIDAETLFLMDKLKTSALIKCACVLGCIFGGRYDYIPHAEAFAENLGIAFQIVDDLLDFAEGEDNSDIVNNKATYVSLFGVDKARMLADEYTEKALKALDKIDSDTSYLSEFALKLLKRTV